MSFSPQKVLDISKVKPGDLQFPMYASPKIDGVYCAAVLEHNRVVIYSRTGKPYTSLKHLEECLKKFMLKSSGLRVVIFEAAAPGLDFPTISGQVRNTKKQATDIIAYVHDALTLEEFTQGGGRTYHERWSTIFNIFHTFFQKPFIFLTSGYVYNLEDAKRVANDYIMSGGEGLVLRDPDATYHPGKRDTSLVKIKRGISYDLKVLCLEEGKGKYKGMVGKLVCSWKDGKTVKVGSGLTDEQRKRWWSTWCYDEIVDKIVQVDAMSESTKGVLRQPIFKGIRFDKTKADF